MIHLISNKLNLLLGLKRIFMLLCFVTVSMLAHAFGTSFTYNYNVTVKQGAAPVGSGTVYLSATATIYDSNKNQWGDKQNPSTSVELTGTTTLSISAKQDREDNDPKKNPYIQFTNVTLKAVPMAGSKFTGWTWSGGSSTSATISIASSDYKQCPNDRGDQSDTYTNSTAYTAQFIPRTYYYKMPGADATEGGWVYVNTTAGRPADDSGDWQTTIAGGTTLLSQTADDNGKYARATIGTYYYYAKPKDGYNFVGWYDKNGLKLSENADFGYNLVATSENKNTPTIVVLIAVFASESPATIYPGDVKTTGLYTGTELSAEDDEAYKDFPYRKKTPIDLTRTFDAGGNALFNKLYIFGMTTNVDGGNQINQPSNVTPCNAKTLCYVYKKSGDEKYYEYETMFDAVSTRFDHGTTTMKNQHLYFTGYCPFANIGVEPEEEGWMYFVGGNEKVDIYLDNCTIIGRYRTTDGKSTGFKNKTVSLKASNFFGGENSNYMTGFSSIFVFESSSNDPGKSYKPTIHISGDNHLKGQRGYITSVVGNLLGVFDGIETGIGNVRTASSPITIKPTSKGGYTDLTMDDLWPTNADHTTKTVTNGFLRLDTYENPGEASEKVPCVDLGSAYGSLTINGGQYMLRNSAADGSYTCNMAFSYRKFSKEAEKYGVKALLSLYGFGGDETDCRVVINGGTFNMYKNMYPSGTSYLGANYYIDQDNFLDLRLPAGSDSRPSSINGGTFNGISHVVFCSQVISSGRSPKAMFADADLCLQDVIIKDPAVARQENGSVHFSIPTPFSDYYSDPKVEYNLSTGLGLVASKDQLVYGGQSVNAYVKNIDGVDKTVVSLLLPIAACEGSGETCTDCELFEEAIYYNWVTAIPKFEVNVKGQGVSVGGEANVPTISGTTIKYVVNQLLYTDLEGMGNAEIQGDDINISFANSTDVRGKFTNTDNYRIYKNLNILKVVEADRWYCFVAPYDIHEISVIETAETQLSQEQYQKDRTAAKKLQAQNNLKLFYELSDFILPDPNGRATSLTLNKLLCNGCLGVPGLRRIPLYHYNGQKAADENYGRPVMTANYYLYETTNSGFDKTTTTNAKDTFHIKWEPVYRTEKKGEPLMRQGQVYAIQFPWCPMCNDWETRTDYDYWTGKLILFYGHGYDNPGTENDGQLIYGINGQTALTAAPGPGQAVYAGNYSFADMTPPSNAFVHDYDAGAANPGDWFIPAPNGHKVKPTEGFLLYNPGGSKMPARISRSGKIEYDENVETGVDGVPTISDRTSLMLFGAYDGFEILSLNEQLVTVYNMQGNIMFQKYMIAGEQMYIPTGTGIFIVRGEHETIKLMVD